MLQITTYPTRDAARAERDNYPAIDGVSVGIGQLTHFAVQMSQPGIIKHIALPKDSRPWVLVVTEAQDALLGMDAAT